MNRLPLLLIVISVVQGLKDSIQRNDDIVLEIPQGKLIGEWRSSLEGRMYGAFESLPYAQPPVGERRFSDPKEHEKWFGTWIAKKLPNLCIQWDEISFQEESVVGQEDCLYLNVYSHNPVQSANLPVIVYVHGGAFVLGSSVEYGPKFMMDQEVVFVTVSYRLGVLGFLTTEDDAIPGNLGMKDQVMALRWVKDNIIYFGGNPDSVTLAGSSAGGASVHFHMLSPMSKGLFHKAISMSGTSFCPWALQENSREKALAVGTYLGCPTTSTKDMVDCLRHRSAHHIVGSIKQFIPWIQAPFSPVAPVVEPHGTVNYFLSENPYDIMKQGKFYEIPWITSVAAQEGLYPGSLYLKKPEYMDDIEKRWIELAPLVFDYNSTIPAERHSEVGYKIRKQYLGNEQIDESSFMKLVESLSDRHFVRDAVKAAKMHAFSSKHPVYFYKFNYRGANSLGNILGETDKNLGVCHCDDMYYIAEASYMDTTSTDNDRNMIRFMTKMWATFARDGNPGVEDWEPVYPDTEEMNYLEISDYKTHQMKTTADFGMDTFWGNIGFKENENWQRKLHSENEL